MSSASAEISDSALVVSFRLIGCAAIVVRISVVRVHFNRLVEIGDGPVEVTLGLEDIATISVHLAPRGDLDCLGEICDRLIVAALSLIGGASVDVSGAVSRVDLNRPGIVGDRSVMIAFGLIGDAAV